MQTLFNYVLFLAETITVVVAVLVILGFIIGKAAQPDANEKGKITVKRLNKYYRQLKAKIETELLSKTERKQHQALEKKQAKSDKKSPQAKPSLFIIDFDGDMRASAVSALREEVTAILLVAKPEDEVCVRLESPGGMVPHYGLATAQLNRLKQAELRITVCVDKVAASGGYMMAAVAHRIVAAPFAIIGSIGVVLQLPNFNRFLDKNAIDFEQLTAGEYKRTLTMFGQNTDEGREKMQSDINLTHDLFKQHIHDHRPQVDLEIVATGEHWFASQAIEHQLVDTLFTSDEYLMQQRDQYDLVQISYKIKTSKIKQLTSQVVSRLINHRLCRQLIYKDL